GARRTEHRRHAATLRRAPAPHRHPARRHPSLARLRRCLKRPRARSRRRPVPPAPGGVGDPRRADSPARHRYRRSGLMASRNDATLAFERIEVRKAPGIHPGFTIDDLSPDINIVFGPNASGKSTTARAIQTLLWPHPSTLRRHELAASFRLGDDVWTVEA